LWPDWANALFIVKADTVVSWHRVGFGPILATAFPLPTTRTSYSIQVEDIRGPENHSTRAVKRHVEGKDFRPADKIQSINDRAAEHDGRFVTVGPLSLFSTGTGDAWLRGQRAAAESQLVN
jgi:hypothetical protein